LAALEELTINEINPKVERMEKKETMWD